jgi:predicted acyltransferase
MTPAVSTPVRWRSLDVFRGATVALMILVNNPGSWAHLYPPLAHAPWHGVTPTDLVFPFFLFAVGNALAFVMPALLAGAPAAFWGKVLRRSLLIIGIGLLLNASPFVRWDALSGELVLREVGTLRYLGVLQRIGLAFGTAAVIVWWLGRRRAGPVLWAAAALLLGYWGACLAFGNPGDPYSLEGFFGTALDRHLLGAAHLYQGEGVPFDPEGLASTVPAVAQVLLGWWVGQRVLGWRASGGGVSAPRLLGLFTAACGLLVMAYVWQLVLPLNKKLWTPSYVLFSTACAMALLVLCLQAVEARAQQGLSPRGGNGWVRFFEVFGRNALFIFVLSGLLPRVLALCRWPVGVDAAGQTLWTSPLPALYRQVFAGLFPDPRAGSLAYAVALLAVYWALAAWLDRRRIYIRV